MIWAACCRNQHCGPDGALRGSCLERLYGLSGKVHHHFYWRPLRNDSKRGAHHDIAQERCCRSILRRRGYGRRGVAGCRLLRCPVRPRLLAPDQSTGHAIKRHPPDKRQSCICGSLHGSSATRKLARNGILGGSARRSSPQSSFLLSRDLRFGPFAASYAPRPAFAIADGMRGWLHRQLGQERTQFRRCFELRKSEHA
jgi:hypothetical protein